MILFFFLGTISFTAISQSDINQTDAEGKRHGLWKKFYDGTSQLRYEGTFDHGKEVGEFKFFCEDCKDKPSVIKNFNSKDDIAHVKYLDKKGKTISEGKMKGHQRVGEWIIYHQKSQQPMSRENYEDGKLHGKKTTYYPNGTVTEEVEYKMGLREGENSFYSPSGILIKKLQYKADELQGPAFYFDGHGNITIEGFYKNDKKHGLWKYYQNGSVVLEETYPRKYEK